LSERSELQRLADEFSEKQKRNNGTFFWFVFLGEQKNERPAAAKRLKEYFKTEQTKRTKKATY